MSWLIWDKESVHLNHRARLNYLWHSKVFQMLCTWRRGECFKLDTFYYCVTVSQMSYFQNCRYECLTVPTWAGEVPGAPPGQGEEGGGRGEAGGVRGWRGQWHARTLQGVAPGLALPTVTHCAYLQYFLR